MAAPLTLLALLIELAFGYPERLSRAIGHPVTWMGRLVSSLDRRLNRNGADPVARRSAGAMTMLALLLAVHPFAWRACPRVSQPAGHVGAIFTVFLASLTESSYLVFRIAKEANAAHTSSSC